MADYRFFAVRKLLLTEYLWTYHGLIDRDFLWCYLQGTKITIWEKVYTASFFDRIFWGSGNTETYAAKYIGKDTDFLSGSAERVRN